MRRISQVLSGQKALLSRHRPSVFEPLAKELTLTTLALHVDDVEAAAIAADAALDARLDAEEALSVTFDSRLDAEEALSVTFDSRLDAVEADIVTIEATLVDTDTRLDLIEADIADLEDRVADLELEVADHETRITALEAGGTAPPSFPTIAATIYERWIFDDPYITKVDGRVSQVTGLINGRTWVQATAANRPYHHPKRFNGGYGCVSFRGSAASNRMTHTPTVTKAIPFTMIVVLEDYTGGVGNQNLINTGSIIWFTSAGNWVCYAGNVAQHTTSGASGSLVPLWDGMTKHPDVGVMVFNGAASVVNAYGTKQTVNSGAAVNALTNGVAVNLCDDGAGTGWARAKIREIVFVEGIVSDAEIALFRTYYSHPAIAGIPTIN